MDEVRLSSKLRGWWRDIDARPGRLADQPQSLAAIADRLHLVTLLATCTTCQASCARSGELALGFHLDNLAIKGEVRCRKRCKTEEVLRKPADRWCDRGVCRVCESQWPITTTSLYGPQVPMRILAGSKAMWGAKEIVPPATASIDIAAAVLILMALVGIGSNELHSLRRQFTRHCCVNVAVALVEDRRRMEVILVDRRPPRRL